MKSFSIDPCPRNFTDQDLWCSRCDRVVVTVVDESTGLFFAHFGTVRAVKKAEDGEWVSVLTDDYEQFVWACCHGCLEEMSKE